MRLPRLGVPSDLAQKTAHGRTGSRAEWGLRERGERKQRLKGESREGGAAATKTKSRCWKEPSWRSRGFGAGRAVWLQVPVAGESARQRKTHRVTGAGCSRFPDGSCGLAGALER